MVDEVVVGSDVGGEGAMKGLDFLSHFMRIRCEHGDKSLGISLILGGPLGREGGRDHLGL